jgi:hypothetical protein
MGDVVVTKLGSGLKPSGAGITLRASDAEFV